MHEQQHAPECSHRDVVEEDVGNAVHNSSSAAHSGSTLKPVQRPNTKTRTQQASEIPPASRAGNGKFGLRSHSFASRAVTNSKITMLMPAVAMIAIFSKNVGVTKYWVAWLMNNSERAMAAITKAAQV